LVPCSRPIRRRLLAVTRSFELPDILPDHV
jgi:hypothetical protein